MPRMLILRGLLICALCPTQVFAQATSVKPGINDAFQNPNPDEFVKRFEIESREVFQQRQKIVDASRIERGTIIADIGAGTGLFTRLFSERVGERGRVVAVDIAQPFLDHIKSTSLELGQQNIETVLSTADSVQLPENSIDVAFICDTYHHFEFPQKIMTSVHRALKPGGRLIVVDFQRIEGESTPWVLGHVRAGQKVVEEEIKQCGFRRVGERAGILRENYFVMFQKLQPSSGLKTSLVPGTGNVDELTGAPEGPRPGGRIVFDITSPSKPGEINPGLERAARMLNLYGAQGLQADDVQITLVLHGDAATAALNDKTPESADIVKNTNLKLIAELNRLGVEILVCGQTLARKKIAHEEICDGVVIATSAMTALMNRQNEGFALMRVQ